MAPFALRGEAQTVPFGVRGRQTQPHQMCGWRDGVRRREAAKTIGRGGVTGQAGSGTAMLWPLLRPTLPTTGAQLSLLPLLGWLSWVPTGLRMQKGVWGSGYFREGGRVVTVLLGACNDRVGPGHHQTSAHHCKEGLETARTVSVFRMQGDRQACKKRTEKKCLLEHARSVAEPAGLGGARPDNRVVGFSSGKSLVGLWIAMNL